MPTEYLPIPQPDGSVNVRVGDGDKVVNRYVLVPGQFTAAATWAPTDLINQPADVRAVVEAYWTPARVNAYKALRPWVPPVPESAESIRDKTFKADAERIDLVDRLRTATVAQIDARIATITTLAQAKALLSQLVKVLATVVRD